MFTFLHTIAFIYINERIHHFKTFLIFLSKISDQRKDMDQENKDDMSWFDKDLDEFDVTDNGIEENSEDEKDLASKISAFIKTLCKH